MPDMVMIYLVLQVENSLISMISDFLYLFVYTGVINSH